MMEYDLALGLVIVVAVVLATVVLVLIWRGLLARMRDYWKWLS
jgi:hypothetical protein